MTEAAAVVRAQSGFISVNAKKDYGPLDFTGRIGGRTGDGCLERL